jgi:hypothetical protein
MVREVKSPITHERNLGGTGLSPLSSRRADRAGGHIAPSPGKGPRLRADGDLSIERGVPVQPRGDRR